MTLTRQTDPEMSVVALTAHNRPVSTISRYALQSVMRKDLQALLKKSLSRTSHDQEMLIYDIKDTQYVVKFLVEWVKTMDVAAALNVCLETVGDEDYMSAEDLGEPEGVPEILRIFHTVFAHFSDMTVYTSDIHDSMVDWYIYNLSFHCDNLEIIFMACRRNDQLEDRTLARVCANAIVHHGKSLFIMESHRDFFCWLQDLFSEEARRGESGDVLNLWFTRHCKYHQHRNNEICYKQMMQQTSNTTHDLPLR